jgi:hypothetical protein
MASTSKCPFCDGVVRSDEKTCPHCGAVNRYFVEDTPRTVIQPKTIEELQEYCAERGMPLLRMRFFIGEDYREPKAFGIYRDGRDVIVYKNKSDGSRAVRYRGPDEAHGVNELFQKLLSECHNRGIYPDGKPVTRSSAGSSRGLSSQSRAAGVSPCKVILPVLLYIVLLLLSMKGFPRLALFLFTYALVCAVVIPLGLSILKLFTHKDSWPEDTGEAATHSTLDWKDRWHYIWKALFHKPPVPAPYSPREQAAASKVGWVPGALRVLFCLLVSLVILFGGQGILRAKWDTERQESRAAYEKLHENDGYYDFGDGRLYYCNAEYWYFTEDRTFDGIWDYLGKSLHLRSGAAPQEIQSAFLDKDYQEEWGFSAYAWERDRQNAEGYYDFGDGALYYLDCWNHDVNSSRDSYDLYYTLDQQKDGAWHELGRLYIPHAGDPVELKLRDGSTVTYSEEARLSRSYQATLGFSEYSYERVEKIRTGYYDFGDGRLYYCDDNEHWSYTSSDRRDDWHSAGSGSTLTLSDQSSVYPDEADSGYLGANWDSDWGGSAYTSSESGSSSSSSSDSSSSDYDPWDPDDTDWDPEW